jgi:TPR repeat protein
MKQVSLSMKRNIRFYFGVIATLLASSLYAASYEDGQAEYEAKDYDEAVEIWESLAEQGDVASLLKMATFHRSGFYAKKDEIVKRDPSIAIKLFQQAVDLGSMEAQLQLGFIYMSGQKGIEPDQEKARELYLKAAKQGYAKAQYYYGLTYFKGEGIPTDYVQAHAWIHLATDNGYKPAERYKGLVEEALSEEQLEESKRISDQLLAEIK